jgi:hypothetical protein
MTEHYLRDSGFYLGRRHTHSKPKQLGGVRELGELQRTLKTLRVYVCRAKQNQECDDYFDLQAVSPVRMTVKPRFFIYHFSILVFHLERRPWKGVR